MKALRLFSFAFLALFLLISEQLNAGLLWSNPYGTFVTGYGWNRLSTIWYAAGDDNSYGSAISPTANGSATVDGAFASSYASVFDNKISLVSSTAVGAVDASAGHASGFMWDTMSFAGAAPGQTGVFKLFAYVMATGPAPSWTDGCFQIEAASTVQVVGYSSYCYYGAYDGSIRLSFTFPLDQGPVQFEETASAESQVSVEGGVYSTQTIVDPSWSLFLPPGVTVTSASGFVYPTGSTPEPGTIALLSAGLTTVGGIARRCHRKLRK